MYRYLPFNCWLSVYLLLASCSSGEPASFWDKCDVIAHWEVIDGDSVMVCDADKAIKSNNVPLDLITEQFQVIKLDSRAGINDRLCDTYVTDNYIGISSYGSFPLKLFKKDGTFLQEIGSLGKGTGEYPTISDVEIDEKNNHIYILPADIPEGKRLLQYDLKGNYLQEIPLADKVGFVSSVKVYPEKQQIVVTSPICPRFPQLHVWIQDFHGNLMQGVRSEKYDSNIYRTNSTMTYTHTNSIELFKLAYENSHEYLYHYDIAANKLVPRFRVQTDLSSIFVYELPSCYIVEESKIMGGADESTEKLIVDKKALKGCKFNGFITLDELLLDQYDILYKAHARYFSVMDNGSVIAEKIKKINLSSLNEQQRDNLDALQQIINKEGEECRLLFIAKFR